MSSEIVSRVYQPSADKCCERCVFGTGEHAAWCAHGVPRYLQCVAPGCTKSAVSFDEGYCPKHLFLRVGAKGITFPDRRRRSPKPAMPPDDYDECA